MSAGMYTTHNSVPPEQHRAYMKRHYVTEVPASLERISNLKYSADQVEQALFFRLQQLVSRDFDRHAELMKIIRSKSKRHSTKHDANLEIHKEDFLEILTRLGVFTTQEMADTLFSKYDPNNRGALPIHTLLTRARPNDFGPDPFFKPQLPNGPKKQGQRLYYNTQAHGIPVQPSMPPDNVYHMTVNTIAKEIKNKLQQASQVGKTNSNPRARRHLARQFEFYDRHQSGYIDARALQPVLNRLNYPLDDGQLHMLVNAFPGPISGSFDYPKFCLKVYPDKATNPRTSLPLGREHGQAMWAFMNALDTDGDGTLSQDEMNKFTKQAVAPKTPPPGTPSSRPGTPGTPDHNYLSTVAGLTTRSVIGLGEQPGAGGQSRMPLPPRGTYQPKAQIWRNVPGGTDPRMPGGMDPHMSGSMTARGAPPRRPTNTRPRPLKAGNMTAR